MSQGQTVLEAAVDDEAIKEGARRIAAALRSPGGQIKLARVVGAHLDWFDLVQQRGLSWDQIIRVLANAGATRENGLPFSRGHLSSAVWRARQERPGMATALPQAALGSAAGGASHARSQTRQVRVDKTAPETRTPDKQPQANKEDLRDSMRRAAEARRRTAED